MGGLKPTPYLLTPLPFTLIYPHWNNKNIGINYLGCIILKKILI